MYKRIIVSLIIILFSFSLANISNSMSDDNNNKQVIINNLNNDKLEFKLKDISFHEEYIDIGEQYNYYAILTINVKNTGLYDFELSNIEIYPYQGNEMTKYFVRTSDEDIKGFIGTLKNNESLNVKIGVALNDVNEKIKLNLVTTENVVK